eukprot:c21741_g1_i1 orf=616-1227(-)
MLYREGLRTTFVNIVSVCRVCCKLFKKKICGNTNHIFAFSAQLLGSKMGHTITDDIEVKVSAKRLWFALVKDSHNFLPKSLPDKIAGIEYEGPPNTPGSIRTVKFHKETHGVLHVKEKIEEINDEELYLKFSVLEGGFGALFRHVKVALHFKDGPVPGTAILHLKVEYEAIGEHQKPPEDGRERLIGDIKAIEAYLQTHNDYS